MVITPRVFWENILKQCFSDNLIVLMVVVVDFVVIINLSSTHILIYLCINCISSQLVIWLVMVVLTTENTISVWNSFHGCNVWSYLRWAPLASLSLSPLVSSSPAICLCTSPHFLSLPVSLFVSLYNESLMTLPTGGETEIKCNSTCLGEEHSFKCLMVSAQANASSCFRKHWVHSSQGLQTNRLIMICRTCTNVFWQEVLA